MKLVRYGEPGQERPGIWLDATDHTAAQIVDVRGMVFDIQDYDARFWTYYGPDRLRALLKEPRLKTIPANGMRLGPPLARPGQLICLGKNYRDHAEEFDATLPQKPIYFAKSPGSLIGSGDSIPVPPGADVRVDGEVELAVVMARRARHLTAENALDTIGGYTILNDVTRREEQLVRSQWYFSKCADGFGPCGPWLVTPDEIPDPQHLPLAQRHNGHPLQMASTAEMIFPLVDVLVELTHTLTLEPGDMISTGTPGGIGSAHHPPVLYRDGDHIECEIGGIGILSNPVRTLV